MSHIIELPDTGLYITLEGGEGSGKSTMIHYLKEGFNELGYEVEIIREPGGTDFSEELRTVFMAHHDLSPETSVHLINAQRQHNLETFVIPELKKGKVVLADRFTASTLIYQGILNDSLDTVIDLMVDCEQTTIFVDVKPEIGLQRISDNNRKTNRFDKLDIEKHRTIYKGYKSLGELLPERYWDHIIDGEQSLDQIQEICHNIAKQYDGKIRR